MPDVKLLKPERLSDNPDGGGLSTGIEIVDGQVNNVFPDVSRIDRVNGDVSLRKVFVQADTPDTELYSGLHLIVQAPPQDPRVDVVAFETGSWSDERDAARQQIERFLDESVITRLIPYDRQLAGQRLVIAFQRTEVTLPEIGDVLVLKNETTEQSEFIRIQAIDHEVQTFSDDGGDFDARVVTLTITQPLSQEFAGTQPNRYYRADSDKSVLRKTVASDAARYYATVKLGQDAAPGDLTIKLETVYSQLVPATTSESGVTDAEPAGAKVVAASGPTYTFDVTNVDTSLHTYGVGIGILPGTVTIEVVEGPGTGFAVEELPDGTFTGNTGHLVDLAVDHERGTISVRVGYSLVTPVSLSFTFTPAATLSRSPLSFQTPIKLNTRGYVYLATLNPIPAPGTLTVSYRALGRWYELVDDGTGALVGEGGTGSGLLNYTTGTVSVSLGASPDIGSSVIYAWGGVSELEIRTTDTEILAPRIELQLANDIDLDSLEISWEAGGVTKTATSNASGTLSGDASGYVDASLRKVVLRPAVIPDDNSTVTVEYGEHDVPYVTENFTPTPAGGFVTVTLADPPKPGTVHIAVNCERGEGQYGYLFRDDGAGNFRATDAFGIEISNPPVELADAEIDYLTGEITVPVGYSRTTGEVQYTQLTDAVPQRTEDADTGYYTAAPVPTKKATGYAATSGEWVFDGLIAAIYVPAGAGVGPEHVEEFDMPALSIDLTPGVTNTIVPGGVLFEFGGRRYFDRAGTLYHSLLPSTGAATPGGTINYSTGAITLTDYNSGSSPAFSIKALLTEVAPLPLSVLHARTPGSPLRPGSFYLQANRMSDGALISAIAGTDGKIDTADMHGYVDVVTGVFSVAFGGYVLDSSLSAEDKAEPWYNAANVDGSGYIYRPREVVPGSVRFNCVVQTSLPLDPEIIGVNPVRLPLDGRVQTIRAGNTLVIHDTQAQTLPDPVDAAENVDLGRTGLASVVVYDQAGLAVPTSKYSVDFATGILTMADPLDLTGFDQPLVALHTIEDMALCTDAQITGEVTLAQPLTNGYTAANSFCSSALILGDVQARYEHLFAQNTWTNVWDDALIGSPPASGAQYNDVTYPLVVSNESAITQRWRINFTGSTTFTVVAEELGVVVASGSTAADVAPINLATGDPYFVLDKDGFGTGWATGNQIRFNTVAAGAPVWLARTVRSGPATNVDDRVKLQTRWDKD